MVVIHSPSHFHPPRITLYPNNNSLCRTTTTTNAMSLGCCFCYSTLGRNLFYRTLVACYLRRTEQMLKHHQHYILKASSSSFIQRSPPNTVDKYEIHFNNVTSVLQPFKIFLIISLQKCCTTSWLDRLKCHTHTRDKYRFDCSSYIAAILSI